MKRKYAATTKDPKSVSENITLICYISDYMRELVGSYQIFTYLDSCVCGSGCWGCSGAAEPCRCSINKPYLRMENFKVYHLCPAAEDKAVKIPRWRALEIINAWNKTESDAAIKTNGPFRHVYFLPEKGQK